MPHLECQCLGDDLKSLCHMKCFFKTPPLKALRRPSVLQGCKGLSILMLLIGSAQLIYCIVLNAMFNPMPEYNCWSILWLYVQPSTASISSLLCGGLALRFTRQTEPSPRGPLVAAWVTLVLSVAEIIFMIMARNIWPIRAEIYEYMYYGLQIDTTIASVCLAVFAGLSSVGIIILILKTVRVNVPQYEKVPLATEEGAKPQEDLISLIAEEGAKPPVTLGNENHI